MGTTTFFVNTTKIYQFKATDSETKKISLLFWKYFKELQSHWHEEKKTGLNRYVYKFSVNCNIINTSNIINIHKYFMKKHDIK